MEELLLKGKIVGKGKGEGKVIEKGREWGVVVKYFEKGVVDMLYGDLLFRLMKVFILWWK